VCSSDLHTASPSQQTPFYGREFAGRITFLKVLRNASVALARHYAKSDYQYQRLNVAGEPGGVSPRIISVPTRKTG
jgi:hypothetical protein